jgi:hypothetical protein
MYGLAGFHLPRSGSVLATALFAAGCGNPDGEAGHLFYNMRQPGRVGVRACINTYHFASPAYRSGILGEMYERRANPSGFGAALAWSWRER